MVQSLDHPCDFGTDGQERFGSQLDCCSPLPAEAARSVAGGAEYFPQGLSQTPYERMQLYSCGLSARTFSGQLKH